MEIESWKTAITRNKLSMPVQWAVDNGIITKDTTVLDYGCGKGTDVSFLKEMGHTAIGVDPHFFPDIKLEDADIVNLGYVLNVIPNKSLRKLMLCNAFFHTKGKLIVSVRHESEKKDDWKPYKDGYITKHNTFQTFYNKESLLDFIHNALRFNSQYKKENVRYVKECFCIIEKDNGY